MTGKGCVAIAADRRYGIQGQVRAQQRASGQAPARALLLQAAPAST